MDGKGKSLSDKGSPSSLKYVPAGESSQVEQIYHQQRRRGQEIQEAVPVPVMPHGHGSGEPSPSVASVSRTTLGNGTGSQRRSVYAPASLSVLGVGGKYHDKMNGIFDITDTVHGGMPVYKMRTDPDDACLVFDEKSSKWKFKLLLQYGKTIGKFKASDRAPPHLSDIEHMEVLDRVGGVFELYIKCETAMIQVTRE
jgi:hypothetical protein